MAEQIASDPAFKNVTETLHEQFGSMFGGAARAGGPEGGPPAGPGPSADSPFPGLAPPGAGAGGLDVSKYMTAMNSMFQNPEFMKMAEQLGKTIMEVRCSSHGPPCRQDSSAS